MIIIRQTAQLLSETEVFSKAISNLGLQKNSARAKKKTTNAERDTPKRSREEKKWKWIWKSHYKMSMSNADRTTIDFQPELTRRQSA